MLKIGPVDLAWIMFGGGWALVNGLALASGLRRLSLVPTDRLPAIGLVIAMAIAGALWFGSRRTLAARSFAIGVLLAYLLLIRA